MHEFFVLETLKWKYYHNFYNTLLRFFYNNIFSFRFIVIADIMLKASPIRRLCLSFRKIDYKFSCHVFSVD